MRIDMDHKLGQAAEQAEGLFSQVVRASVSDGSCEPGLSVSSLQRSGKAQRIGSSLY